MLHRDQETKQPWRNGSGKQQNEQRTIPKQEIPEIHKHHPADDIQQQYGI